VLAAALRLYPAHRPYVGEDTQEAYPRAAMLAIAEGHWRPRWIVHGPGFFDALRGMYSAWYGVGRVAGRYRDRVDFLASFATRPLPFVAAGRLLVVACALVAVVLVASLGKDLDATTGGLAGAALLAVTFSHVRESHQVWPDVPAGTLALAAVSTSMLALRRSSTGWVVAASILAGFAIATKPSAFPVALPVALAAFLGDGPFRTRVVRAVLGGLLVAAAFSIAAPYALLQIETARDFASRQLGLTVGSVKGALPLRRLVVLGLGLPLAVLG